MRTMLQVWRTIYKYLHLIILDTKWVVAKTYRKEKYGFRRYCTQSSPALTRDYPASVGERFQRWNWSFFGVEFSPSLWVGLSFPRFLEIKYTCSLSLSLEYRRFFADQIPEWYTYFLRAAVSLGRWPFGPDCIAYCRFNAGPLICQDHLETAERPLSTFRLKKIKASLYL